MTTRGSSAWRLAEWGAGCDRSALVTAYWIAGAGKITCHRLGLPAFRALGRVFQRHGYHVRTDDTGCYNCRKITGGSVLSAHAHAIAVDVNASTNPYRLDKVVTDMPTDMVREALAIKTDDLHYPIFRSGADWDGRPETPQSNYDPMHWELVATPYELAAGFSAPVPTFSHSARDYPLLARGEHGPAVRVVQAAVGTSPDGIFGPITEQAVTDYQTSRKLTADGVVGLGTWTAILTHMPALGAHEPSPIKLQPKGPTTTRTRAWRNP